MLNNTGKIRISDLGLNSRYSYPLCKNIRIYHEYEGRIEESLLRIAVRHHEACRVVTKGDPDGQIFLSYSHPNNEFFFLLTFRYDILFLKKDPRISKYEELRQAIMTSVNITMTSLGDHVREFQYNQCM